jgi:hypothetical protein
MWVTALAVTPVDVLITYNQGRHNYTPLYFDETRMTGEYLITIEMQILDLG